MRSTLLHPLRPFARRGLVPTDRRLAAPVFRTSAPRARIALLGIIVFAIAASIAGPGTTVAQGSRPDGFRQTTFAFENLRLVVRPGHEIPSGTLVVRHGRIVAVGKDVPVPADARRIDGQGLVAYPGFVDAGTSEFFDPAKRPAPLAGRKLDTARSALAATPDDHRRLLTPEFSVAQGLKSEAAKLDAWRAAGFTAFHVLPNGHIAAGTGALVAALDVPPREAVLVPDTVAAFQLFVAGGTEYPATLMGTTAHLRQFLLDAGRHRLHVAAFARGATDAGRPPVDPAWDALAPVFDGTRPALFEVTDRDEVERTLAFCREFGLHPWLWGVTELDGLEPRLVEAGARVLLPIDFGPEPKIEPPKSVDPLAATPPVPLKVQEERRQRWTARVALAGRLHRAGVPVLLSTKGLKSPADLLAGVRQAIAAGWPREAALAALTRDPAAWFGLDARTGTLEPDRLAHVVLTTGPFDHPQAKVRWVLLEDTLFEYNPQAKPVGDEPAAKPPTEPPPPPLPDVAGTWNLAIVSAKGTVPGTLQLVQDGPRLTGRFRSEQGQGTVSSGTVKADGLEFVVAIGAGAESISLSFSAPLAKNAPLGGKLSGELKSPFGAATSWTAVRSEPEGASKKPNPDDSAPRAEEPKPTPGVKLGTPESSATADVSGTEEGSAAGTATASPEPQSTSDAKTKNKDDSPSSKTSAKDKKKDPQPDAQSTAKPKEPSPPSVAEPAKGSALNSADPWPVETEADRRRRPTPTHGKLFVPRATILTGSGARLVGHAILVRDGKIAAIGPDLKPDEGMTVLDVPEGWFVAPGMIDTHSHIMVQRGVLGVNEATLSIVPEVRIADALVSDDPAEFRALAGGVTTIRILHGSANAVGGQDAIVKLRYGDPLDEHLLDDAPRGVKFALGENVKFRNGRFPNTRMGVEAVLQRAFAEALEYRAAWQAHDRRVRALKNDQTAPAPVPPRRDLRLEALVDILEHRRFVHCHSYRADEILMLLRTADALGFRIRSLQHVLEGYKVAPEIVAHGASCSTFSDWWAYKVEAYDATPYNAALLVQAGANAVLKSDDPELMRHLNAEAAKTVRYGGLAPDEALALVTRNAARELGIADRVGTLEPGKDADFALFNGHPLDAFARCEATVIDGAIRFVRRDLPTAMSPATAERTRRTAPFAFPDPQARAKPIDWTVAPNGRYALVGAVLHPVEGPDIPGGTLLVEDGRIAALGPAADVSVPDGVRTLDVAGLHVWPGLIDAGTPLGLVEIGKVAETHDEAEIGELQPDLRAGTALNPDSELLPVARAGGITAILMKPQGGIIAGQCALARLGGWTAPEMVLDETAGLQVTWPAGNESKARIDRLAKFLDEARTYDALRSAAEQRSSAAKDGAAKKDDSGIEAEDAGPALDPRYEALRPYLSGRKPVFFEAHARADIAAAIQFAEKQKLRPIVTGGRDAWKLAGELARRGIPVIVGPVMQAPGEHDPFDASYANPGRLHEAGVRIAIRSNHGPNSRNTPFEAAMAVAHGLPEDAALKAVTLAAAEILGAGDRLGSLRPGKIANLVIADGSPLQPSTAILGTFVAGRPHPAESRHTRLHDRYRGRLLEKQTRDAARVTRGE